MSYETTSAKPMTCAHCGGYHTTTCPRIRAIDYHQDGSVKRIEFHTYHAEVSALTNFKCGETPARS